MTAAARNPVVWASSRFPLWAAFGCAATYLTYLGAVELGHFGHVGMVPGALPLLAGAAIFVLAILPRRIEVGAEGLRISWLGALTVSYRDVRRAAPIAEDDVLVILTTGVRLRLTRPPLGGDHPRAVLDRLWATVSAGAEERITPAERALLGRGARTPVVWAREVSAMVAGAGGYRAGIPVERLWLMVENPAVEAELRVAAAVALAGSTDTSTGPRLEEIARTTLDDDVRGSFSRIAHARGGAEVLEALARGTDVAC
jgi:hypothetical protein